MGRITELIQSGKLFADLEVPTLDPAADRVMICGSPGDAEGSEGDARGSGIPGGEYFDAGGFRGGEGVCGAVVLEPTAARRREKRCRLPCLPVGVFRA